MLQNPVATHMTVMKLKTGLKLWSLLSPSFMDITANMLPSAGHGIQGDVSVIAAYLIHWYLNPATWLSLLGPSLHICCAVLSSVNISVSL